MKKLIFAIALLCLLAFIAYIIMAPRSYDGDMIGTVVAAEENLGGFDTIFLVDVHIENGKVSGTATLVRSDDHSEGTLSGEISTYGRTKLLCTFEEPWAGILELVGTVKWGKSIYEDEEDIAHGDVTITQIGDGDGPKSPYKDASISLQPWPNTKIN